MASFLTVSRKVAFQKLIHAMSASVWTSTLRESQMNIAIAYILNVPWWTLYKDGDAEEDRADQASLDAYIASPTNRADTIIDCLNPDGIKKFLEYSDMLVSSDRYRKNVIKITPADSRFLTYFGGSPDAPTYPPFDFHKKDSDKK